MKEMKCYMREFKKVDRTLIKSDNTTNKIFNRYLYCLICFVLLIIISNLIDGTFNVVLSLIKSLIISLLSSTIIQIIFNSIKKDWDRQNKKSFFQDIFIEKHILTISLIIGLFAMDSNIYVGVISSIITVVIKNIFSFKTISSTLYGILVILVFKQFQDNLDTPLTNLTQL